jgi:hypothetical protein
LMVGIRGKRMLMYGDCIYENSRERLDCVMCGILASA